MKGSIKQRGNSFAVKVSYKDSAGKWRQVWRSAKTRKEAERVRTRLLTEHDAGTLTQPKGNVGDFLNRWWREYALTTLSPTTAKGYKSIIDFHIIPAIGALPLRNLRPEHLQSYYADKVSGGLSTTSVRHHHALFHRAFKQACQWGLLSRNPADMVSAPHARKIEMRTLNDEQISAIFSKPDDTIYRYLFYTALQTGLRRGELLALRWSDIDLELAEMSVSRSTVKLPGGKTIFKTVKTARSRRMIALSPQTCIMLRAHLDKQMGISARLGLPFNNDTLVFCHVDGSPLLGNSVWKTWHTMLARMGITGIPFHNLRHTMATAMLRAGVHPKIVQERLGHSSIAVTLDVYSHVSPGLQQVAATKLDSIFTANFGSNSVANTPRIDKVEAVI